MRPTAGENERGEYLINRELTDRVEWIDAAKGIGIILVVLGHIWIIGEGYTYINSFHVPLFFFLSGYVANYEKHGLQQFVAKKFTSLVIPYIWFSLLTYCYWVLIEKRVSGNGTDSLFAFQNIFLSPGSDRYMPHNPALWFLTCLFIVAIMFYPIANALRPVNKFLILFISSAMGYYLAWYLPSYLPWSIDVALTGVVFYGMGYLIKNNKITQINSNSIRLLLLCCSLTVGYLISQLNGPVAMAENHYGNYVYFYTAACLGILSAVVLSMFVSKSGVLRFLGKNSIIILALHFPVKRLVTFITSKALNVSPDQVKGSFIISGIDTAITILILVPAIYLIRNYLYFVLGRRRPVKRVPQDGEIAYT